MHPNLTIQIPEPCHEDWNKMTPNDKGSFCGSCEKTVVDFSKMNDVQIAQYVLEHPNEKMCGRFANTQLNRSLAISRSADVSALKAFIYILFMVFGASLFSFTYVKNNEDKMKRELSNVSEERTFNTVGLMLPCVTPVVEDITPADTTVIESGSQMMTAGLMVANYKEPVKDSVPEYTISAEKDDQYLNMTVGGMMVTTECIDNRFVNFFPEDSIAAEKKDSVSQKTLDKIQVPMLESYPNPSGGAINIKYTIPQRTDVLIELYDINGNKVKDIVSTSQMYEGTYIYPADLSELSDGTYICRMIAGERSFSTKILVQK